MVFLLNWTHFTNNLTVTMNMKKRFKKNYLTLTTTIKKKKKNPSPTTTTKKIKEKTLLIVM